MRLGLSAASASLCIASRDLAVASPREVHCKASSVVSRSASWDRPYHAQTGPVQLRNVEQPTGGGDDVAYNDDISESIYIYIILV